MIVSVLLTFVKGPLCKILTIFCVQIYIDPVKLCVVFYRVKGTVYCGWSQFDWMLDGGSSKAQPIEFQHFCFKKKPIDVSHK
jgi:hypothetical protein